jgi:hypothetical protein
MITFIEDGIFWYFVPCSLLHTERCFTEVYFLQLQCDNDGGSKPFETLVPVYTTKWHNVPEDSQVDTRRHENLISQLALLLTAILYNSDLVQQLLS